MVAQRVDPLLPPMPTSKRLRKASQNQVKEKKNGWDSPSLANFTLGLKLIGLDGGSYDVLSIDDLDIGAAVDELGSDVVVRIGRVLRLDDDTVGTAEGRGMNWYDGLEL